jgi:transcriptional regulator with XRE-family HTH domain
MSDLPKRMKRARLDREMTQPQLADVLGIGQPMVAMIEDGTEHPSSKLEERISAWIASGRGPRVKSARGPYKKGRASR